MNGGLQQFARVAADTPPADRWDDIPLITNRCIPVCVDEIADCTLEQWEAIMAAKYGEDAL